MEKLPASEQFSTSTIIGVVVGILCGFLLVIAIGVIIVIVFIKKRESIKNNVSTYFYIILCDVDETHTKSALNYEEHLARKIHYVNVYTVGFP